MSSAHNPRETTMTTTKKLMTAAFAVAALATASHRCERRCICPRRAWWRARRRIPWRLPRRREVLPRRPAFRSPLARSPLRPLRRYGYRLQHLLEVHAVRPRERLPRAALLSTSSVPHSGPPGRNGPGGFVFAGYSVGCRRRVSPRLAMRYPWPIGPNGRDPGRAWRSLPACPTTFCPSCRRRFAAALFAAARPHRLKADQTLFTAGDPGDGCYRVEQGLLKVSVVSPSGGERILAILGPGTLVGELAMIDAQPRSASVDGGARFRTELHQPRLVRGGGRKASGGLSPYRRRCWRGGCATPITWSPAMSFLSLKGRVAQALLSLAEAFGHDVGAGRILVRQKVDPERPCRDGRDRARERQPHPQRLDARQSW